MFSVTLKDTKCKARKLKDGSIFVQGQVLSQNVIDLPRINYKYNAKPYSYAYGVEVNPVGVQFCRVSNCISLWIFSNCSEKGSVVGPFGSSGMLYATFSK